MARIEKAGAPHDDSVPARGQPRHFEPSKSMSQIEEIDLILKALGDSQVCGQAWEAVAAVIKAQADLHGRAQDIIPLEPVVPFPMSH